MRGFLAGWGTGILTLPVLAIAVAWLGFWPALANGRPPTLEKAFAQMALNAYVSRHAPHVGNQIPCNRREPAGRDENIQGRLCRMPRGAHRS
jgi:hypothetical protein